VLDRLTGKQIKLFAIGLANSVAAKFRLNYAAVDSQDSSLPRREDARVIITETCFYDERKRSVSEIKWIVYLPSCEMAAWVASIRHDARKGDPQGSFKASQYDLTLDKARRTGDSFNKAVLWCRS
jgi:hypothetical protein